MLFRPGLLLATLFLCITYGFAQNADYTIAHYTTEQGLPQNSVKTINFDQAGYCWLGTEMGLVRFDGANFKVFGSDNIKGLLSDRIRVVARDTSGSSYVEMDNGQQMAITISGSGTAPFPRLLKGRPMCFSFPNNLAISLPVIGQTLNNMVHAVQYIDRANFFIATQNGNVYFVMNNKMNMVNGNNLELIDSLLQPGNWDFAVVEDKVIQIFSGNKIKVWEHGILQPHLRNISGPLGKNKHFISGNYKLVWNGTGVYIHTDKTIFRIDIENNQLKSEVLLENIDIPDIHAIYYHPKQQKYYIGTLTSGLYIISPNIFRYPKMTDKTVRDGFHSQIATKGGAGIVCEGYLYRQDGTFETLPTERYLGAALYLDVDNALYYGSPTDLLKFNLNAQRKTKLFNLDSRLSGIIEDKTDSCIFISTALSVGRLCKDTFTAWKQVPDIKENKIILGIVQTGKDSFLLSTQSGLKWYDWAHNLVFYSILDSARIRCVYIESADCMWISTYGQGFFLYSKGKVNRLPYGPLDALKSVHSFVDDGRGFFWLPTNTGLYKVRKDALLAYVAGKDKDVYYYSFSTQNGLRSNEFNGGTSPHHVWLKDSMLSLLSIKGPVWFYPNNVLIDYPDKHIYVDQLKINDSVISYPVKSQISLPPDFNNITLTVSSPYFSNRENQQLKYKIEGIGTDWQPVATNGNIQLNRVPSGHYKIIVRKLTGLKPNQYESLTMSITVKPWFYNTWWFYTAALVLIGFVIYFIIKLRIRLLIDRNKKLQSIIESQTEGLTKTVALLSTSEQELKESNLLKDNVITMVLHDLRSPIRFLHLISRKTATRHAELDKQELGQKLVEINTSIAALSDFTEQFFGWAISQRKDFKVNKASFDLQLLFEETTDLYEDLVKINNNTLKIIPGNYQIYTDRNILSVIIRNLLDNANKNTSDGAILLYASYTSEHLVITVSDTGKGLRDAQLDAFMAKDGNRIETGSGYGSMIILNLLEKIGGVLKIDTELNTGARFHVWLDCSSAPAVGGNILRSDEMDKC